MDTQKNLTNLISNNTIGAQLSVVPMEEKMREHILKQDVIGLNEHGWMETIRKDEEKLGLSVQPDKVERKNL